jgi:DNA polymerase I-like protein with 3'-5' exonuclease and polymerase domains
MSEDNRLQWELPKELPDWSRAPRFGLDVETKDPELKDKGPGAARNTAQLVGVSLAVDFAPPIYLPLRHEGGGNWPFTDEAIRWLKCMLEGNQDKIGANIFYDIINLRADGIKVGGAKKDVQIMEALLNENRSSYSLEAISKDYLGIGKDEELLKQAAEQQGIDPKAELYKLHSRYVGSYAEADAVLPLNIYDLQIGKIIEQKLESPFALETELVDVLVDMHMLGIQVDIAKVNELIEDFSMREEVLKAKIYDLVGECNIWSNDEVGAAYEKVGIVLPRTATGKPSIVKQWLENQEDELSKNILDLRKYDKTKNTFLINSILNKASAANRIHPRFLQVRGERGGTKSYRFSSIAPNMQQMPARDEDMGPLIRKLFLPEQGCKILAADYSAQEIRIANHLAISMKHSGWTNLQQAYANDKHVDFHQLVSDWTGLPRKIAKVLNLSIQYGAGKYKIAAMLGVSMSEAENILATYHRNCPYVSEAMFAISKAASDKGFIKEVGGRRCRFEEYEPDVSWNQRPREAPFQLPLDKAQEQWPGVRLRRAGTFKALNRWIQSSAATQTKKAMVDCWKAGHLCHLTVHDELVFSVENAAQAREIKEIMENAVQFKVPAVVDIEWGPSWGELVSVEDDYG